MTETITPLEGLLLRAAVYELLAVGYSYPSDEQRQRVQNLASELEPYVGLIRPEWPQWMEQLGNSLQGISLEDQVAEFNRLFSGSMEAVPYETAFDPDIFRKQHALADIAGFYRAFNFQVAQGSRWQPDHIGVELEYCSVLLQRTAQAMHNQWEEQASVCVDALRTFLLEHLGRWSASFAEDLQRQTVLPFYQQMARFTREWLEVELTALDLEPDRLRSRQVYADDLQVPSCGGCTGCGPEGPTGDPCPPSHTQS